ncbi:MAG TPA: response regulator [Anaerolineae bacterium]|nr:response regulator [Anaerolineae bacterium]HQK12484.1 response regulator [Anaerolineae bacterium]
MMHNKFALIIEDEEDLATIFSEALKAAGFETEIIYDGFIAANRLREVCPAIVVLDLNLPHVDGKQLLEQIRNDPRLKDTRVLIATADAGMADMIGDDADLVLLKPISFVQLRVMAERIGFANP